MAKKKDAPAAEPKAEAAKKTAAPKKAAAKKPKTEPAAKTKPAAEAKKTTAPKKAAAAPTAKPKAKKATAAPSAPAAEKVTAEKKTAEKPKKKPAKKKAAASDDEDGIRGRLRDLLGEAEALVTGLRERAAEAVAWMQSEQLRLQAEGASLLAALEARAVLPVAPPPEPESEPAAVPEPATAVAPEAEEPIFRPEPLHPAAHRPEQDADDPAADPAVLNGIRA